MSSINPTGGSPLFYQQPTYQQQNPLTNIVNDFTNSINSSANDFQTSMRRAQRTWNGEPEYSVARIASWGGGAALAFSIADSTMRSRPEGLLMLGLLGIGAFAGNKAYDWFMDRFGQNFGW